MKIGIDIRCLAQGRQTGVEEYVLNLLPALFAQDQKNEYILFFNAWKDTPVDFSWAEAFPHVRIHRTRYPNKLLNLGLWYLCLPKIDQLLGGIDLFFSPNMNFVELSNDVKHVITIHDLSYAHYTQTFSWKRRLWHYLVNPRLLCKEATNVIAVSDATRDDLRETYHLPTEAVTTIHHGLVPHAIDNATILRTRNAYDIPQRFILSFGTIEPRKNLTATIAAYNRFRERTQRDDVALVLAGAHGWAAQSIYAAVDDSCYRADIRILHDLSQDAKAVLYHLADAFVYPSHFEGFGFPPLEAMQHGTPVITSHTSSLPELVGESAIMVDPDRPEEITRALQDLFADEILRQQLITKGHENVKHFTWEKAARETLEVFENVCSKG